MNEQEKQAVFERYNERTHLIGRAVSVTTLILLVGAPFVLGVILGAMPDVGAVARSFLSVGLVWMVSGVAEYLIYTGRRV